MNRFQYFVFLCLISIGQIFANQQIKVATFNIGMLGIASPVPYLEERQEQLKDQISAYLEESQVDVLAIQEMWTKESKQSLMNVSENYELINGPQGYLYSPMYHMTGLAFLVKKTLKAERKFKDFRMGEAYVCVWGKICKRGMLSVVFEKEGQSFEVVNTHLTPLVGLTKHRKKQIKQMARYFNKRTKKIDHVILAADLNIAPKIGMLKQNDEGSLKQWQDNGELYNLFFEKTAEKENSCLDSISALNQAQAETIYTQDRERNVLTASSASTKVEPSQRIDHIISCSHRDSLQMKALNYETIFNEASVQIDMSSFTNLSDHFGIEATYSF